MCLIPLVETCGGHGIGVTRIFPAGELYLYGDEQAWMLLPVEAKVASEGRIDGDGAVSCLGDAPEPEKRPDGQPEQDLRDDRDRAGRAGRAAGAIVSLSMAARVESSTRHGGNRPRAARVGLGPKPRSSRA